MIMPCKTVASHLAIAGLFFLTLGQTMALAASVTYTVVDENIYDKPIKTQIVLRRNLLSC